MTFTMASVLTGRIYSLLAAYKSAARNGHNSALATALWSEIKRMERLADYLSARGRRMLAEYPGNP